MQPSLVIGGSTVILIPHLFLLEHGDLVLTHAEVLVFGQQLLGLLVRVLRRHDHQRQHDAVVNRCPSSPANATRAKQELKSGSWGLREKVTGFAVRGCSGSSAARSNGRW